MEMRPRILLFCAVTAALVVAACPQDDKVAHLQHLEGETKDGVIVFTQDYFDEFALTPKRDYTLVAFLYAKNLMDNPQLQLKKVAGEFSLAAKAFKAGGSGDKIFFISVAFEDNQNLFKRLGVNQAPFIFTWQPKMAPKSSGMIDLSNDNQMLPSKTPGYPWKAEDFVAFVSKQTGIAAGEVFRPTLLNDPFFPLYAFVILCLLLFTAYRAYQSPLLRIPIFWVIGSLLVYWFATSGGLFNIIRGMPMYFVNKEGKLQFFLQGRQGQLGAEGFLMGGSYVLFCLLMAGFTYGAPKVKDHTMRSGLAYSLVFSAAYLLWKIFDAFTFKNGGYWIRQYFFPM